MKKTICFFSCLLFFAVIASVGRAGSFGAASKGTTAAGFLKIGAGARAVAMGEAYSAIADDATALYWNPAAMRQVRRNSLSLMHASYLDASNFEYGAFVHSGQTASIGGSVQYFSVGRIKGRDESGIDSGGFEPSDMAITLGYARNLNAFSIGVAGKFIQSKIIDTAQTQALDIGILSPKFYEEKARLAFTASNIGGKIKFDETSESLPLLLKVGSGFNISTNWLLSMDIGFPKDNNSFIAAGTDYRLSVGNKMSLAGRAGYNSKSASDVSGFAGFSFGAGFTIQSITLDYGFVPFGDIGSTHRVSISSNF